MKDQEDSTTSFHKNSAITVLFTPSNGDMTCTHHTVHGYAQIFNTEWGMSLWIITGFIEATHLSV
uniref:Uncharacterized protein n=1 Tax=Arion vulgaris TaxID=1028688 RepID=A0A0B7AU02_9EUPU